MDPRATLSSLSKKRSHIKGLITKQVNRTQEFEKTAPSPEVTKATSELFQKIRGLDDVYNKIHFDILECRLTKILWIKSWIISAFMMTKSKHALLGLCKIYQLWIVVGRLLN